MAAQGAWPRKESELLKESSAGGIMGSKDTWMEAFLGGFLHGMAAPLMLCHPAMLFPRQPEIKFPEIKSSDAEALASDWRQVGQDMWKSMCCYGKEHNEDK